MTIEQKIKKQIKQSIHDYSTEIVNHFNMDIKTISETIGCKENYTAKKKVKSEKDQKYFTKNDLSALIDYSEMQTKKWQIKRKEILEFVGKHEYIVK